MPDLYGIGYPSLAIIGDFNTLTERIVALTDSYRLLVGAAEELTRTPSANEQIIYDAINRTAFLGMILDQLLAALQISLIISFLEQEGSSPNPFD